MTPKYIDIDSIADLHKHYNLGSPKHPLITLIDLSTAIPNRPPEETPFRLGLYGINCKRFKGVLRYGKSRYDFDEGSLMFTAPQQVIVAEPGMRSVEGWGLWFHPDLLYRSELGRKMHTYGYFSYDVNEALHVSEEEGQTLLDCLKKIETEYTQKTDRHTQGLIIDNLQLMLNYCLRFYDRQFLTRATVNNDIVQQFDRMLTDYFSRDSLVDVGIPDVGYFATRLHLSPSYLSDLLHKYTGKTTQEHIHLKLADKAKSLLWGTGKSVSEIAYDLGFEHPSHFSKLFKAKTGTSPKGFRNLN